jgi:hypothetical protein
MHVSTDQDSRATHYHSYTAELQLPSRTVILQHRHTAVPQHCLQQERGRTWCKVHGTGHALATSIPPKGRDEPRDRYAVPWDDQILRHRHRAHMGPVPVIDTAPTRGQSQLSTQRPQGASPGHRHRVRRGRYASALCISSNELISQAAASASAEIELSR